MLSLDLNMQIFRSTRVVQLEQSEESIWAVCAYIYLFIYIAHFLYMIVLLLADPNETYSKFRINACCQCLYVINFPATWTSTVDITIVFSPKSHLFNTDYMHFKEFVLVLCSLVYEKMKISLSSVTRRQYMTAWLQYSVTSLSKFI